MGLRRFGGLLEKSIYLLEKNVLLICRTVSSVKRPVYHTFLRNAIIFALYYYIALQILELPCD